MGEERTGCFTLIVFLMPCDCSLCFVARPWVGLQWVIVLFSDHTNFFFYTIRCSNTTTFFISTAEFVLSIIPKFRMFRGGLSI